MLTLDAQLTWKVLELLGFIYGTRDAPDELAYALSGGDRYLMERFAKHPLSDSEVVDRPSGFFVTRGKYVEFGYRIETVRDLLLALRQNTDLVADFAARGLPI